MVPCGLVLNRASEQSKVDPRSPRKKGINSLLSDHHWNGLHTSPRSFWKEGVLKDRTYRGMKGYVRGYVRVTTRRRWLEVRSNRGMSRASRFPVQSELAAAMIVCVQEPGMDVGDRARRWRTKDGSTKGSRHSKSTTKPSVSLC